LRGFTVVSSIETYCRASDSVDFYMFFFIVQSLEKSIFLFLTQKSPKSLLGY